MLKRIFKNPKYLLILILISTAILRLYNLWYPTGYVFDEVYHGFTAKEYLFDHKEAWEWWNSPPAGVAYEWTHPPVAKEIMAFSMGLLHTTDAWAYRLPGALLGILSVYLVYLLGKKIFHSEKVALISAFAFSLDGLNFVQSRTAMNDIYFVAFALACVLLFLNGAIKDHDHPPTYLSSGKSFLLSAIFLGLAVASKWTGFYLFGLIMVLALFYRVHIKYLLYFYILPPLIYLFTYLPFFLINHQNASMPNNWDLFVELQRQMWYYHTGLKATHDYTSPWWSWPLNLKPVWYFVDYDHPNSTVSNIFASGNPLMFLFGSVALLISVYELIRKRTKALIVPVLGYLAFWLPWALSPRIMFLYHYAPSVPFMCLLLGYQINQLSVNENKRIKLNYYLENILHLILGIKSNEPINFTQSKLIITIILILIALSFLFVYPMLIGIPLDRNTMLLFFRTNLTKNPFGW